MVTARVSLTPLALKTAVPPATVTPPGAPPPPGTVTDVKCKLSPLVESVVEALPLWPTCKRPKFTGVAVTTRLSTMSAVSWKV